MYVYDWCTLRTVPLQKASDWWSVVSRIYPIGAIEIRSFISVPIGVSNVQMFLDSSILFCIYLVSYSILEMQLFLLQRIRALFRLIAFKLLKHHCLASGSPYYNKLEILVNNIIVQQIIFSELTLQRAVQLFQL